MPFSNPIAGGGGRLVREAIQSADWDGTTVAAADATAGWRIERDGSAAFYSGTFRGILEAGEIHLPDAASAGFHADSAGNVWAGSIDLADSLFRLTPAGAMLIDADGDGEAPIRVGQFSVVSFETPDAPFDGVLLTLGLGPAQAAQIHNLNSRLALRGSSPSGQTIPPVVSIQRGDGPALLDGVLSAPGDLRLSSSHRTAPDAVLGTTAGTFRARNARIGSSGPAGGGTGGQFGHKDVFGDNGYAVRQQSDGSTLVNSVATKDVSIKEGGDAGVINARWRAALGEWQFRLTASAAVGTAVHSAGAGLAALYRLTSSIAHKADIEAVDPEAAARRIASLDPVEYRSAIPTDDDSRHRGFIAEWCDKLDPLYGAAHDDDGRPQQYDDRAILADLVGAVQYLLAGRPPVAPQWVGSPS